MTELGRRVQMCLYIYIYYPSADYVYVYVCLFLRPPHDTHLLFMYSIGDCLPIGYFYLKSCELLYIAGGKVCVDNAHKIHA